MKDLTARRRRLRLEDARTPALPVLLVLHARLGIGDGVVTSAMAQRFIDDPDGASEVLRLAGFLPSTGEHLLQWALEPWADGERALADGVTDEITIPPAVLGQTAGPASVERTDEITLPPGLLEAVNHAPAGRTDEIAVPPALASAANPALVERTNVESGSPQPAPGRIDGEGRIFAEQSDVPLDMASPQMAVALEAMAQGLEEGLGFAAGSEDVEGAARLMTRVEEAVAVGLGNDRPAGLPVLDAVRLRVSAMAIASALANRADDEALRRRAAALLGHLLVGEPRRSVRAALAASLLAHPDLPPETGDLLLEAGAGLMPKSAAYAQWETSRSPDEPLWVRHVVYAPEYRILKDGYEAAGFTRINERPLHLLRELPGGRPIRVELRRVQAGVVINDDKAPEEVLILGGLATAVELSPPPIYPRLVVAAFRRDPFGVPRLADRFPGDHLLAIARGEKPLDDAAFMIALLESLSRREPYALMRSRCRTAAPLISMRALWPHEPGALRAAGGAPAPFTTDAMAMTAHRITHAVPRPPRRPFDLRPRNDSPDTTSHLALEVATSLACAALKREELPVLEPGGFHEGQPDIEVNSGAALWRISVTRALCGQAEEALTALVTLHTIARRATLLGASVRPALLAGAIRAGQIANMYCATEEFARDVTAAVLRHAGMPAGLSFDELRAAADEELAERALYARHGRWLEG